MWYRRGTPLVDVRQQREKEKEAKKRKEKINKAKNLKAFARPHTSLGIRRRMPAININTREGYSCMLNNGNLPFEENDENVYVEEGDESSCFWKCDPDFYDPLCI